MRIFAVNGKWSYLQDVGKREIGDRKVDTVHRV